MLAAKKTSPGDQQNLDCPAVLAKYERMLCTCCAGTSFIYLFAEQQKLLSHRVPPQH
jgi:gluconate kinase